MRLSPKALSLVVFTTWIGTCLFTFWWFQFRHIGSFENNLATFDGSELSQFHLRPADNMGAIVVHFIDPDCPCSRFSIPHVEDLEQKFAGIAEFRTQSSVSALPKNLRIPATPAVAIWNKEGDLAYFGPYSGGAICGTGSDFVATVFNQLQNGVNPQWINLDAVGCFCPHGDNNKVAML